MQVKALPPTSTGPGVASPEGHPRRGIPGGASPEGHQRLLAYLFFFMRVYTCSMLNHGSGLCTSP